MRGQLKVIKSTLSAFNNVELNNVTLRHVEFDKLIIKNNETEFALYHRNLIFEEQGLRLNGFVIYNGIMGQLECIITFQDG